MKFDDLKFHSRDFLQIFGPGQGGPTVDLYYDFKDSKLLPILLANHTNSILQEKLNSQSSKELELIKAAYALLALGVYDDRDKSSVLKSLREYLEENKS